MSQEAVPEQAVSAPDMSQQQGAGAPKGLLQQMEELMAALTADLSRLDADLQSSARRADGDGDGDGTLGGGTGTAVGAGAGSPSGAGAGTTSGTGGR
ncbi:hypothetical protein [Streptomyces sp. CC77]|uniref:hypothetical protein n=1 Tax=Streptomyces sp. CC77 TaxID=1906739 RepID=UPI0008DDB33D|nr:hypothetical protein [Streptomyces sp. CC77]OII66777.1 hypothetical protein BJP39_07885 [Streptomyces sp. CC77]